MKIIFWDHDGVICLPSEFGGRFTKRFEYQKNFGSVNSTKELPVHYRFDNFNKKAVVVLNEILTITGAEIVVSSDWKNWATVEEMGKYYEAQGIIKKPIDFTPKIISKDLKFFHRDTELEETRSYEIKEYLGDHPEVTKWVAVDDLDMHERFDANGDFQWGLKNFVLCPRRLEGIKQTGIKEKIIGFLR